MGTDHAWVTLDNTDRSVLVLEGYIPLMKFTRKWIISGVILRREERSLYCRLDSTGLGYGLL
jgi:hypothetical protein